MHKQCLLAGLVLAISMVTYAQDSQPPQSLSPSQLTSSTTSPQEVKIDPAKEADIRRLLEAMGTKAVMKRMMATMSDSMKPVLMNSLPPGEYRAKLVDAFMAKFLSRADPQYLLNLAVPIYDRKFSHDEIKGLLRFYESPLGQKAAVVLPEMSTELYQAGQKWGEDLGRQTMMDVLADNPDLAAGLRAASSAQPQ